MSELFYSIIIAILVGGVLYAILEFREIFAFHRDSPSTTISGMEALIGRKAKVQSEFEAVPGNDCREGRVLIDGESWKAELAVGHTAVPQVGHEIEIISVNSSTLKVIVE